MARTRKAVRIHDGTYYMYLRKSRKDLEREKYGDMETLARHEADLDEVCERDGYPVEGKFKELVSGESISERKEFQKLMELVSQRKVTGVIVHAVDRLGRGSIDEYGWVIATLQRTHTLVITPGKVYDPTDSADYMALIMLMIISSGELAAQKERYRDGRNRSSKSGEHIAKAAPYGYDKAVVDKSHTLVPNDKAGVVRMIFDMAASGTLTGTIARTLNEKGIKTSHGKAWYPGAVQRIVQHPVYKGMIRWGKTRVEVVDKDGFDAKKRQVGQKPEDIILVEGLHEAIVDEELWQKANDALVYSPRTHSDRKLLNPLAGILRCPKCGHTVVYSPTSQHPRATSNRFKHRAYTGCDGWLPCDADKVVEMVVDSLMDVAGELELNVTKGEEASRRREEELDALRAELRKAERQADVLIDMRMADPPDISIEAFRKRNAVLQEQIQALKESIEKIESSDPPDYREMSLSVKEVAAILKDPRQDAERKNSMLKRVVKRIDMVNHATEPCKDDVDLHIFLRE